MSFHVQQRDENGISVLSLQGNLDAAEVLSFKKDVSVLSQRESPHVILDCSSLEFVDSTGLGSLISLLRKLEAKGGKLAFAALSPEVSSIFEITRLHKLFEIYPSVQNALEKIRNED